MDKRFAKWKGNGRCGLQEVYECLVSAALHLKPEYNSVYESVIVPRTYVFLFTK